MRSKRPVSRKGSPRKRAPFARFSDPIYYGSDFWNNVAIDDLTPPRPDLAPVEQVPDQDGAVSDEPVF